MTEIRRQECSTNQRAGDKPDSAKYSSKGRSSGIIGEKVSYIKNLAEGFGVHTLPIELHKRLC